MVAINGLVDPPIFSPPSVVPLDRAISFGIPVRYVTAGLQCDRSLGPNVDRSSITTGYNGSFLSKYGIVGMICTHSTATWSAYGLTIMFGIEAHLRPSLMAIFLLAIPCLILEVSIGQAYRGGTVVAFNNVHRRMKGVGIASMLVSATGGATPLSASSCVR